MTSRRYKRICCDQRFWRTLCGSSMPDDASSATGFTWSQLYFATKCKPTKHIAGRMFRLWESFAVHPRLTVYARLTPTDICTSNLKCAVRSIGIGPGQASRVHRHYRRMMVMLLGHDLSELSHEPTYFDNASTTGTGDVLAISDILVDAAIMLRRYSVVMGMIRLVLLSAHAHTHTHLRMGCDAHAHLDSTIRNIRVASLCLEACGVSTNDVVYNSVYEKSQFILARIIYKTRYE